MWWRCNSRPRNCWPTTTIRSSRSSGGTGWPKRCRWTRASSTDGPGKAWNGLSIWRPGWTSTGRRCERPDPGAATWRKGLAIMTVEQQTDETALDFVLALHRVVRSLRRSAAAPGLHPTQLLVLVHLVEVGPS